MKFIALICFALVFISAKAEHHHSTAADPSNTTPAGSTTAGEAKNSADKARQLIKAQLDNLSESCKAKTQIPPEQSQILVNQQIPKTEAEKCYLECIYNGIGLAKDNQFFEKGARILAQKRFSEASDELAKSTILIDTCSKEAIVKDPSEKCAIGRAIRECFVKNGAKINFFPKA